MARLAVLVIAGALAASACGAGPTASPGATPGASFPGLSYTGGTARASVAIGEGEPTKFAGGRCERPSGGAWLAVDIGDPNGAEYFGLLVGRHPYGGSDSSPVASGGTFPDGSITVSWRHDGMAAAIERGTVTVELEAGAQAGTFSGRLPDGTEVTGDFGC